MLVRHTGQWKTHICLAQELRHLWRDYNVELDENFLVFHTTAG